MAELAVIVVVLSAAISVAVTGFAAAWAEKHIGSAAVGAMVEKEELFGKGLVLTVIPETIVIFGLTVALVLLFVVLPQVL
ncbi:MAG TPA: V-type ATP synthase subunit K [Methanofastidiosum sp.]|jgi:V/A-type H+-transporting ATPase subunit K|nr:MAG: V-type ATP synthase subunit K [Firmicutes bacterium ADurb.Bin080]HOM95283.1 V-type ATP synthase subunit K [Methanofastidiosum sp.]HOR87233.1 V-type ATP synthase subunit K [Methanofastidiosum sp.]HOT84166.1 V-type ATP synthase subunit K [Methanofastidiosum sp.]HPC80620.1 V-type ATP synthase subunit K [Methanofastidiosum sp.]